MSEAGGTVGRSGRPALSRLTGSVGERHFATDYWGRRALLSRGSEPEQGFDDLFAAAAVDELIAERGLRTPFLRVARNGSTLPERSFTAPGGVGAMIGDQLSDDRLARLFADGATLVLQGLHRTWRPVLDFSQQLAAELGHPVQVNAYVTPPQSQGFSAHYDTHDVFVLQISGRKRWRIHEPVLAAPLRSQGWNDRADEVAAAATAEPAIDATLQPGDCLYLPRGYLHAATALGTSIHLTIGVHPWTRRDVAEELTRHLRGRLDADPALRESLPLGVDLTQPAALRESLTVVASALREALDSVLATEPAVGDSVDPAGRRGAIEPVEEPAGLDAPAAAAAMVARAEQAQRPEPLAPLRQHEAVATLTETTELRLRRHLLGRLEIRACGTTLLSRVEPISLAEDEVAQVTLLLSRGDVPLRAAELGLELAERLLRGGVVVPVS